MSELVLSQGNGRALGHLQEVSVDAPKPESYLTVAEIADVEPLDAQMGVWPQRSAPDALIEPLFGQPDPTDADVAKYGSTVPELKTYAILDAAKMSYLLTGLLDASNLRFQCLYQGEAQEELGEVAPYLVEIEQNNNFTKALFTDLEPPVGLWSANLGIFLRSRASFEELRQHFRKFTRVQDRQSKWRFFNFWDGRVANEILAHADDAPKLAYIYLGDETLDIHSCIYRNFDDCLTIAQKTGRPFPQGGSKIARYEDIEAVLRSYSWKNYIVRATKAFETEFGDAGEIPSKQWITETCDSARSHGFKIELAIYNFLRSRYIAEIEDINFQDALSWVRKQNPGWSTMEISKSLWENFDRVRTRVI